MQRPWRSATSTTHFACAQTKMCSLVMDDVLATNLLTALRNSTDRPALDCAAAPTRLAGGFWAELLTLRLVGSPDGLSGDLVARG